MSERYYIWRCPIEECRNLTTHGQDKPGRMFEDTTPWCHGKDAPPYPGSHKPVAMERIALSPSGPRSEERRWTLVQEGDDEFGFLAFDGPPIYPGERVEVVEALPSGPQDAGLTREDYGDLILACDFTRRWPKYNGGPGLERLRELDAKLRAALRGSGENSGSERAKRLVADLSPAPSSTGGREGGT